MAKILIVDDSRTSRKVLRGILESKGHTVVGEACNGQEAVVLYEELRPELVTMDITMPIMDDACVLASPQITANHVDASLIHEAAIGKIAGEQIIKLMTLGLTEEEAEAQIVNGFLK